MWSIDAIDTLSTAAENTSSDILDRGSCSKQQKQNFSFLGQKAAPYWIALQDAEVEIQALSWEDNCSVLQV
jgi:hypothetical protein